LKFVAVMNETDAVRRLDGIDQTVVTPENKEGRKEGRKERKQG